MPKRSLRPYCLPWQRGAARDRTLIRYDLSLETFFTFGPVADVSTRPVLSRREGQPVFMRGEVGIKDDGQLCPLVAHNTTHLDLPLHFVEGGADLHAVLNNPAYRINLPMLVCVLDLATWPAPHDLAEHNRVRYCEQVTAAMLPPLAELQSYDALIVLTGFGAVMRHGSAQFHPDAAGFYHLPYITVEVAQRMVAGLAGMVAAGGDEPGHAPAAAGQARSCTSAASPDRRLVHGGV